MSEPARRSSDSPHLHNVTPPQSVFLFVRWRWVPGATAVGRGGGLPSSPGEGVRPRWEPSVRRRPAYSSYVISSVSNKTPRDVHYTFSDLSMSSPVSPTARSGSHHPHLPPPKKCAVDENHCVSLTDILVSFSAPISEEHAWALCYQCAKCFVNAIKTDPGRCRVVTDLSEVLIHKDGHVHANTIFKGGGTGGGGSTNDTGTLTSSVTFSYHWPLNWNCRGSGIRCWDRFSHVDHLLAHRLSDGCWKLYTWSCWKEVNKGYRSLHPLKHIWA